MIVLDIEERKQIAGLLSKYDSLFYAVMGISEFHISKSTPTAAVALNKETLKPVYFFNPEFWQSLSIYEKAFIISHEILHFILGHLGREKYSDNASKLKQEFPHLSDKYIHKMINFAMDLGDNHTLINAYGFEYEKMPIAPKLCWVHTVFPTDAEVALKGLDPALAQSKIKTYWSFEQYLPLVVKLMSNQKDDEKSDENSEGNNQNSDSEKGEKSDKNEGPAVLDDHQGELDLDILKEEGIDNVIPFEDLSDDQLEKANEEIGKELDQKLSDEEKQKLLKIPGGQKAGQDIPGVLSQLKIKTDVVVNKKWETVCLNQIASILKMGKAHYDSFNHIPNFMRALSTKYRLPDFKEVDRKHNDKFKIVVFIDGSGSMISYIERLLNLLNTVPSDKFEVIACVFADKVKELSKNKEGKFTEANLQGIGCGTVFSECESFIQKKLQTKEWDKYPDLVWMWTDGVGNVVQPQNPKLWTIFLTGNLTDKVRTCFKYLQPKSLIKIKDFM